MQTVPAALAARLDNLKDQGVIAGWQDAGGPNAGLSTEPLPALIFPASGSPASSFYDENDLSTAVTALEVFGPIERAFTR